jgi:hypothetical protein
MLQYTKRICNIEENNEDKAVQVPVPVQASGQQPA